MCPLTTRLWCMGPLLLNILTILTHIRATCPEQPWHGARELRWGLQLGALGVATGAIAIGTAATSTSTTIIISIRTTISTASKTVSSNTTHNTAEMLPMVTGEQQIGLVAMRVSSRVAVVLAVVVASEEQVVQVAPVVRVVRVAPAVPENQAELVVS